MRILLAVANVCGVSAVGLALYQGQYLIPTIALEDIWY